MKDVYAIVSERVIALLEKGTIPWQKPWSGQNMLPRNLVSNRPYRGVNTFLLHTCGYQSPFWLTFKQAQDLGGNVRKGEKSFPVVFWKWLDIEKPESGEQVRVPFLRYYSVFNVAQCDGIQPPPLPGTNREHTPLQEAERIIQTMPKRPEIRHGLDRAFYSPGGDFVGMPAPEQFRTGEEYYSVLFHELTHSTGHESRLARKQTDGWQPFGSESYSKEELVAEMGAAFLCGHAGLVERTIDNSAAYIAGWLERLRNDHRLVVQAAALAQKASDFILNVSHEREESGVQS